MIIYDVWACQPAGRQRNPGGWSYAEQGKGTVLRKRKYTKCLQGMNAYPSVHLDVQSAVDETGALSSSYTCSSALCYWQISILAQHHQVAPQRQHKCSGVYDDVFLPLPFQIMNREVFWKWKILKEKPKKVIVMRLGKLVGMRNNKNINVYRQYIMRVWLLKRSLFNAYST